MAALAQNGHIKKVFFDIAKEEKTHMGEFQALLLARDEEQVMEIQHGKEEVNKLAE